MGLRAGRRWRDEIRNHIVRRGIKAVCGTPDFVSTSAAADISLLSGGLRFAFVRMLAGLGIKNFVAKSGLGYDFVCHTGDLAEYPFYHRRAFERELAISVGWLHQDHKPVVYDLGANVGFISTHLAQMLARQSPKIYAFEPAPATYQRLVESVERLGLGDRVHPIAAAATDSPRTVRISFPNRNSLQARVVAADFDDSPSETIVFASGLTLDEFSASMGAHPALIKMDVEGSEVAALRGAGRLLSRDDRPAVIFEYNPESLAQSGAAVDTLRQLLSGYTLYYVDDLRGQLLPFGSSVASFDGIDWICNLFAVPLGEPSAARWASALNHAKQNIQPDAARLS